MNAIEHAVALPPDEVVVHRATRRKILRNIAPLTTGAQDVHQAVHHRTHVGAALAAARPRRRNERRDNRPLLVREVARVPQMITIVSRSVFLRPHRQPHESDCLLSITNDSSDSRSFKTDTKICGPFIEKLIEHGAFRRPRQKNRNCSPCGAVTQRFGIERVGAVDLSSGCRPRRLICSTPTV